MQKGFSIPSIIILITTIIILSLVVFFGYNRYTSKNIKGVTSGAGRNIKPGFGVEVVSQSGTWDMYEYLCEDMDTCLESLYSGVLWRKVGGGTSLGKEVFVVAHEDWKIYEYIKVFVKPGWGSPRRVFKTQKEVVPVNMIQEKISQDGVEYEVTLFPVSEVISDFYKVVTFSDILD